MSEHFWVNLNKMIETKVLNKSILPDILNYEKAAGQLHKNLEALAVEQFGHEELFQSEVKRLENAILEAKKQAFLLAGVFDFYKKPWQKEKIEAIEKDCFAALDDEEDMKEIEEFFHSAQETSVKSSPYHEYELSARLIAGVGEPLIFFENERNEIDVDDKKALEKLSPSMKKKAAKIMLSALKTACGKVCFSVDLDRYFSFIDRYASESVRSEVKNLPLFPKELFFEFKIISAVPPIIIPRQTKKCFAGYKKRSLFHCDHNRQINILKKTVFLFLKANHVCQIFEGEIKSRNRNKTREDQFFKENIGLQLELAQALFSQAALSIKEIYQRIDSVNVRRTGFLSRMFKGSARLVDELMSVIDGAYRKIISLQVDFVRELKDQFIQWSNLTSANLNITSYDRQGACQKIVDQINFIQGEIASSNMREADEYKNNLKQWAEEMAQHVNSAYFIKKSLSVGKPAADGQLLIDEAFAHFVGGNVVEEERLLLIKSKLFSMDSTRLTQYWIERKTEHGNIIDCLTRCLDKTSENKISKHAEKYIEQAVDYFILIRNEPHIENLRNIFQTMIPGAGGRKNFIIMKMLNKLCLSKKEIKQILFANKERVTVDCQLRYERLQKMVSDFKKPVGIKINCVVNEMINGKVKEIDQVVFKVEHWDVVEKLLKESGKYTEVKMLIEDLSRLKAELSCCEQKISDFECEAMKGALFSFSPYKIAEFLQRDDCLVNNIK